MSSESQANPEQATGVGTSAPGSSAQAGPSAKVDPLSDTSKVLTEHAASSDETTTLDGDFQGDLDGDADLARAAPGESASDATMDVDFDDDDDDDDAAIEDAKGGTRRSSSGTGSGGSGDSGERGHGTNMDSLIGRVVVEKGLATTGEIRKVLDSKRADASSLSDQSLFDLLVEHGVVTRPQVERIKPEVEEQKAGRQIPGYKILSKLGKGAMATVYKARQLSLDRLVAIKVLPQKHTANPDFVRRFREEGRVAARLNHPNIVGALEIGQSGKYHYFVMEYVEGRTVYDDIVEHGAYSEEDAIKIAIQVGTALQHAHSKGLIHRDVKPKNIIMTRDGVAKLADMGLARAISDAEAAEAEEGKAFGTPYYISPEQIRGEIDVDHRADIYSFGAMLYHMVTGRVPFEGPSPSAVMHQHLKADLVPPDHINENLSNGIAQIIEYAMIKDRDRRYADMRDMLEDLEAVAEGRPPMHAKPKFDVTALGQLDESPGGDKPRPRRLEGQRDGLVGGVLVTAIMGWIIAFVLFVIVLVQAVAR